MQSAASASPTSKKRIWIGRILSGLAVAFLLFDATIKLLNLPVVVEAFARLGFLPGISVRLGILLLTCVVIYLIPATSVLGAILLTGYLGGAVATHVRVGDPLFSHVLFPTYMGLLIWGGLYLREDRLSGLLPLRS